MLMEDFGCEVRRFSHLGPFTVGNGARRWTPASDIVDDAELSEASRQRTSTIPMFVNTHVQTQKHILSLLSSAETCMISCHDTS